MTDICKISGLAVPLMQGAESGSMWAAQPTSQTSETQAAVVPEVRVVPKHTRQVPGNPLLGTNKKFLLVKAAREKRQNTLLAQAAREREDARQASMPYWWNTDASRRYGKVLVYLLLAGVVLEALKIILLPTDLSKIELFLAFAIPIKTAFFVVAALVALSFLLTFVLRQNETKISEDAGPDPLQASRTLGPRLTGQWVHRKEDWKGPTLGTIGSACPAEPSPQTTQEESAQSFKLRRWSFLSQALGRTQSLPHSVDRQSEAALVVEHRRMRLEMIQRESAPFWFQVCVAIRDTYSEFPALPLSSKRVAPPCIDLEAGRAVPGCSY